MKLLLLLSTTIVGGRRSWAWATAAASGTGLGYIGKRWCGWRDFAASPFRGGVALLPAGLDRGRTLPERCVLFLVRSRLLRLIPGMTKSGVQKRPGWLDSILGLGSE